MAVARGRGLCRMCGERYAGLESVDIFEPRGAKPAYCDLLRELLGLNPYRGDMKPERLGSTCAKLLDEWERFRDKCTEAQKILKEKCLLAQKKQNPCDEPVASSSGTSQPKQSNDGAGPSSATAPTCTLKRPLNSDSDDSEDEDVRPNTKLRRS